MTQDTSLIRKVEGRGWITEAVEEDGAVIAKCPGVGCGLRFQVREGAPIPAREESAKLNPVRSFDDARRFLLHRRQQLCLSIKEVEACAGLADDHLAKFERDNATKIPNVQTFFEWAATLGFEVVLVPGPLPPITAKAVAGSRHMVPSRRRMFARGQ